MSKEIAKVEYDSEKRAIVKKSVCPPDINESEFAYFIEYCLRTGLDPISKQIYCMKVGGKMQVMASIDGLRLIAERSGHYAGQRGPWWCGDDGKWTDVWLAKTPPAAAKVCVLRSDFTEPLCAVAKFDSYKRGNLWNTMPEQMIAKVAESLALRRAFPNELSGIYSSEEMEQAGVQSPTAEPMTDDVPPPVIRLTRAQKPVTSETPPVEYKDAEYDEERPEDAYDENSNVLNPTGGGGQVMNPPIPEPDIRAKCNAIAKLIAEDTGELASGLIFQASNWIDKDTGELAINKRTGEVAGFTDPFARKQNGDYVVSDNWIKTAYGNLKIRARACGLDVEDI